MAVSGGGPFGVKDPHIANDAEGPYGTHPYKVVITDANGNVQASTGMTTVNQGAPGTSPWLVSWSGQSISVSNFPATQPVSIADGIDATQGAKADTATTGTSITTASFSVIALLKGIYNSCVGATPAGTNIIGKIGIDQTTPGTTNRVAIGQEFDRGASSSVTPRVAIANDSYIYANVNTNNSPALPGTNPLPVAESGATGAAYGITPTVVQSNTALVGKGSSGNLYGMQATLVAAASAQTYLVAINSATAPAAGASITPLDIVVFPSNAIGATASISYGAGPANVYSSGIVLLVTTSLTTYTAGANSFISARVR